MKHVLSIYLSVACILSAESLKLVNTTDLPGISGDLDHMAIDAAGQRLFLAAEDNGTLRVIDLKSGKLLHTVKGFHTPHSILYLPEVNELYIADGSKAIQVLDSRTFQVKRTVATTPGSDSIAVDRDAHLLYAVSGGKDVSMKTSVISVINTQSAKLEKEIAIDAAHVEAMALGKGGPELFVNVTDKNYLAVIDRKKGTIVAQWHIAEARQNAPIAFDEAKHRLFVVCRDPGMLVVLNSQDGHTIASFPTGAKADEVVFDAARDRIYVLAGEGKIYPYQQENANHYKPLNPVPSASGAKTGLLSPDGQKLFVAVSPGEGRSGAKVLTFEVQ